MTSETLVALRDGPADPGARPRPRRRRGLPVGWPLFALYYGFPIWWLLGAGQLIWPFLAIPMLGWLLRRDVRVRWPKGFGLWLGFIFWMLASVVEIHDAHRLLPFAYRGSLYIGATIVFLYVYNLPESVVARIRVVKMLVFLFLFTVVGGFLGLAFPHFSFTSPLELALPHHFRSNPFVHLMVHPGFAQVQSILGFNVAQPRPSAPFVYTNEWGANLALLIPFVFAAAMLVRRQAHRLALRGAVVVAIVPILLSLNRGLWVGLLIMALYVAFRFARRGKVNALVAIVMLLAVAGAIALATPIGELLITRVTTHSQSNTARLRIYQTVIESLRSSPLFGFATPLPPGVANAAVGSGATQGGNAAIGSQGQLWLVLYSHGYPGGILFVGWFVFAWLRTLRARSPLGFWCNVSILMMLALLPVYGMIPAQLFTAMIAAALGFRDRPGRRTAEIIPRAGLS